MTGCSGLIGQFAQLPVLVGTDTVDVTMLAQRIWTLKKKLAVLMANGYSGQIGQDALNLV